MTDDNAQRWRSRRKLILVFLLFFVPVLAAWALILSGWRPGGTVNHGTLIEPPRPAAELPLARVDGSALEPRALRGQWNALLLNDGACEEACLQALDKMVRVHIALNKDADRVRLYLVLPDGVPAPELPAGAPELLRLPPDALPALAAEAPLPALHLSDPYGYRMMRYPPPLDAQGLLKDLRRLLRLSNEEVERFAGSEEGAR